VYVLYIGPSYYDEAVLPFYKALKVYPAPMELIEIYQKTIPEAVFQTIVSILAIEVRHYQDDREKSLIFIFFNQILAKGYGRSTH
jgi:hypothetical protein